MNQLARAIVATGVVVGVIWVIGVVGGCKDKAAEPVQAASVPPTPPAGGDVRTRGSLTMTERAGAFDLVDGAKHMKITLPAKPQLQGDTVSQDGVEAFNAQAVMPGGPVDVQFGVITMIDDALPPSLIDSLATIPAQLATATGGTLVKNDDATLLGAPGRVFELTTTDGRRVFGWYLAVAAQGRMYQLNCVGVDAPASRTACESIFKSLALQ